MGKTIGVYVGLLIVLFGSPAFSAECQSCKAKESASALASLITATQTVVDSTLTSCGLELTKGDVREIRKMRSDLIAASKKSKGGQDRSRVVSKIVAAHEKKLSKAAIAAILAEGAHIRLAIINQGLKVNPGLASTLARFEQVTGEYTKNRNRMFGGVRGVSRDDRKLDLATAELKASIKASSLDPDSKKILTKNMYAVLSGVYQNASKRALEGAERASLGVFVASSVLSADLIALSYLGLLTPVGAVSGTAAKVAVASASSAAGGAGLMGLDGLGRMAGYAAVQKEEGRGFFCKLSDQVERQGREVLNRALTGAVIGGGLGGGLAGVATVDATAAKVLATGASGLFAVVSGKSAIESHGEAKKLRAQAESARLAGNFNGAAELENSAKRAEVDTAASSLGTLLALSGAKFSKGLRVSAGKNPKSAAKVVPAAKAPTPAKSEVCPVRPASASKAAKGALVAAGAATAAGCGSEHGDSAGGDGGTTPDGTDVPVPPSACAATQSCAVRLAWDASPEVASAPSGGGYKIYWGTTPGLYSNWIDVGNKLEAEVTNLGPGTYYFTATAYLDGQESGFSNVVSAAFSDSAAKEAFPQAMARVVIAADGQVQVQPVQ